MGSGNTVLLMSLAEEDWEFGSWRQSWLGVPQCDGERVCGSGEMAWHGACDDNSAATTRAEF